MTFNLEKIQEMWEKDAVIDPDNLHRVFKDSFSSCKIL